MHFNTASAGIITYVDRPAFDAGGPLELIDFESTSVGTIASGSTLSGITFLYNFAGVSLTVENLFDTTSGAQYLGTDDGGLLQDGDDLTFTFSPVTGFGLYIISQDPTAGWRFYFEFRYSNRELIGSVHSADAERWKLCMVLGASLRQF